MKIFQPMLFVGLGGTGCLVGAELERRLRDELCGPDGELLSQRSADRGLRPYQLPSCVQFVYADFSEGELNRLPYRRAEDSLRAAYSSTSRATQALLPRFDSSREVALRLRNALPGGLRTWLPPHEGEPSVAPLSDGAGQLPTVGRACFYEAIRNGLEPAVAPVRDAISAIMNSGTDIAMVGGDLQSGGCDVFVAFSVAGGTGAGIFYDYLHLLAREFDNQTGLRVKIYPLVVMPSAFPERQGGGRAAELNAARAVVDLFRLVDTQNRPDGDDEYGYEDASADTAVTYPSEAGRMRIQMRSSTVQTAFLFNGSLGIERRDLHRSIVSMIMSLIGTGLDRDARSRGEDDWQSFADSFVNDSAKRGAPAATGIGRRGVSTGLVASMTVPADALAELMAGHLLAAGVNRLEERARTDRTSNAELIRRLFAASGIEPVWSRKQEEFDDPEPVKGAAAILAALAERHTEMQNGLDRLDRRLTSAVPTLAAEFNPRSGALELLGGAEGVDPFRLYRIVVGQEEAPDRISREGFRGMLQVRRSEPERPHGVDGGFPQPGPLKNPMPGIKLPWGHEDVRAALDAQDTWYGWRSKAVWHQRWNQNHGRWNRTKQGFDRDVAALRDAFLDFLNAEKDYFQQRTHDLYNKRTAVSYLLPPQSDLDAFYDKVRLRLVDQWGLPETADEADLLRAVISAEMWQQAFSMASSGESGPVQAVVLVRRHLKRLIAAQFAESGDRDSRPLLPDLGLLLEAAARGDEYLSERDMQHYQRRIASLMPAGFVPQGSGPLKVLIVYPETKSDPQVRTFLRNHLLLPRDNRTRIEFRTAPTQSIAVVMFRTNMSLTDVPEVRQVLRVWAEASVNAREEDHLAWRQRIGWREDGLAGTPAERVKILHSLLCAVWNGQVTVVQGTDESPTRLRVELRERDGGAMMLDLERYGSGISSWGSVLRAYENWTLHDEGTSSREFCERLLATPPAAPESAGDVPSPLYLKLVNEIAPRQVKLLDRIARDDDLDADAEWLARLRRFWVAAFESALDLRVPRANHAATSLRRLTASWEKAVARGTGRDTDLDPDPDPGPRPDRRASRGARADDYDDPEPGPRAERRPSRDARADADFDPEPDPRTSRRPSRSAPADDYLDPEPGPRPSRRASQGAGTEADWRDEDDGPAPRGAAATESWNGLAAAGSRRRATAYDTAPDGYDEDDDDIR